ncbi:TIGR04552 family protein, partial [bacterium]|nr:TIGR04552 family protein [bacterium]
MSISLEFDPQTFQSLIGGTPILEAPAPQLHSLEEARSFIRAYGYDLEDPKDEEKLWHIHSRAVTYLKSRILREGEVIPEDLTDPALLKDLSQLLLYAREDEMDAEKHRWSCVILKVMHVVTHLQNDLFSYFSSEIQEQIFKPYRNFVRQDPATGLLLGGAEESDPIRLQKMELKPFKDSNSAITKLLSKPEAVAFGLMDKIGVRIVTQTLLDVFRVMQFLVRHHVVSYPHVVPGQSNNSLFPVNHFLKLIEEMKAKGVSDPKQINERLKEEMAKGLDHTQYLIKRNEFTASDYKFIKFINRQLVKVRPP